MTEGIKHSDIKLPDLLKEKEKTKLIAKLVKKSEKGIAVNAQ